MTTAAQDEFNDLVAKNNSSNTDNVHPEDRNDPDRDAAHNDNNEEDDFRDAQIDAAMRVTPGNNPTNLHLPPASFDNGRSTGVKGVIADARSYETAKKSRWADKIQNARRSIFGGGLGVNGMTTTTTTTVTSGSGSRSDSETDEDAESSHGPDEEAFLQQWRESRRKELESESRRAVNSRRTSPSVRVYGRLDEVDALGYLDAIEKVSRDTTVVVFVYDHECEVSETIQSAMMPLVRVNTSIHFVKVHYDEIEFDNAAVPAVLAYRNQGDLFANLTGIIEMISDDEPFGTNSLSKLFQKHGIL